MWMRLYQAAAVILVLAATNLVLAGGPETALLIHPTPSAPGLILFRDDFATYSGRWSLVESPKARADYSDSALVLQVMSPGKSVWSLPDFAQELRDQYRVEVTAGMRDGGPDALFGLVLQYTNEENFYALVVGQAGEWRFMRRDGTTWIDQTPPDAVPFEHTAAESKLRLIVEAKPGSLALYVDGQLVEEVAVEPLPGEGIGVVALAGKGYIDVVFDDVLVLDRVGR